MSEHTLHFGDLAEVLCAIHLGSYVPSPVADRGGVMLVCPPGTLKTTALSVIDRNYHNALMVSNLNVTTLLRSQSEMFTGSIRSLLLADLEAIYSGDPRTAARVEMALMQLAGEGHHGASWQDARHQKFRCRCTVFAALTPSLFMRKVDEWQQNGFLRRFVWVSYALADADVLHRALMRWQRASMSAGHFPSVPVNATIQDSLTEEDRAVVRSWLKYQPGPHEVQLLTLCRALSVLRWHYKRTNDRRDPIETMRRGIVGGMLKEAGRLVIDNGEENEGIIDERTGEEIRLGAHHGTVQGEDVQGSDVSPGPDGGRGRVDLPQRQTQGERSGLRAPRRRGPKAKRAIEGTETGRG